MHGYGITLAKTYSVTIYRYRRYRAYRYRILIMYDTVPYMFLKKRTRPRYRFGREAPTLSTTYRLQNFVKVLWYLKVVKLVML